MIVKCFIHYFQNMNQETILFKSLFLMKLNIKAFIYTNYNMVNGDNSSEAVFMFLEFANELDIDDTSI